jgi:broad specificity phosphatase PhoE
MIYLIRHAESEGNFNPVAYTKKQDCDIELTPKGEAQAKSLAEEIQKLNLSPVRIFYSPYLRARKTAGIVVDLLPLETILLFCENPLLVERNWGELRDRVMVRQHINGDFGFFNRPNRGESFFDLYQRVIMFRESVLKKYKSEDILIFTHGEWMKIYNMIEMCQSVEGFNRDARSFKVPNCKILQFPNL